MKLHVKKYSKLVLLLPILGFSIMLFFVSPESIVNYIGVENTYLFMFFMALLGGISLFSGVPYPMILITLALGGANWIFLGVASALGVILGDSTSYLVGKKSDVILSQNMEKVLNRILHIYDSHPKLLPYVFFAYGTLSPFPNDIITLSSGIKKYNFWKTMLPLALGNLIFCLTLAKFSDFFSIYF